MSDRELLEMAAKAAGMPTPYDDNGVFTAWIDKSRGRLAAGHWWSPLTDDGDALRLAVKLCMNIEVTESHVYACTQGNCSESAKPDRYAAVRRAIVRAAAEIGRMTP